MVIGVGEENDSSITPVGDAGLILTSWEIRHGMEGS